MQSIQSLQVVEVRLGTDALGDFPLPVSSWYRRIDQPATPEQKASLKALTPASVTDDELAGDEITAKLTEAPGNDASIGGLKVVTDNGWFAARPSGTEAIYKVYAESFVDESHLERIHQEARAIVDRALAASV